MTKAEPKVIFWDIETSHNVVATFQLWGDQYIPHQNILQERYIICACWKELGKDRIHTVSTLDDAKRFAKNPHDDYHVIKKLREVLSDADVIVAHNGDKFDTKFFQARALYHGFEPIPPVTSIDTYKVAKQQFNLNSNRLDYIGSYLGLGGKKATPTGLWLDVLKGDRKAIKTMVEYNKRDVELLEGVFLKLRPYIPNHLNRQLFGLVGCPRCGSDKVQSRGVHRAISRVYKRFQCQTCAGWFRAQLPNKGESTTVRVL